MMAKAEKVTEQTTEPIDTRLRLKVRSDFRKSDFTTRRPSEQSGITGETHAPNEVIDLNKSMEKECDRIAEVLGKEGSIAPLVTAVCTGQRAEL